MNDKIDLMFKAVDIKINDVYVCDIIRGVGIDCIIDNILCDISADKLIEIINSRRLS